MVYYGFGFLSRNFIYNMLNFIFVCVLKSAVHIVCNIHVTFKISKYT